MSSSNLVHFMGDYDNLVQIIKKANRLAVVDFFASWCGPCKYLGAQLPGIAAEYPDVHFVKIDTDQNRELSQRYGVTGIPHIKFFKPTENGLKDLGTVSGADIPGIKAKIAQLK